MGGNYTHTTRAPGTILTADIFNSSHQNHIDNATPAGLDDYASTLAQFKSTADPGEVGTESLPTSLAGELERLRWRINELGGTSQWYETGTGSRLQGFTLAGLPPAGTAGRLARVTDDLGGPWMDSGSAWNPLAPWINAAEMAGANAGAQIIAAIARIPTTGGIVDARRFRGSQTIASTITIDRPILLLVGAAEFVSSATPTIDVVTTVPSSPTAPTLRLVGLGPELSIFQNTPAGTGVRMLGTSANNILNSRIANVSLKGTNTGGFGIQAEYTDLKIINTHVRTFSTGISLVASAGAKLLLVKSLSNGATGLVIGSKTVGGDASNNVEAIGCVFNSNGALGAAVTDVVNVGFVSCDFSSNTSGGITIDGGADHFIRSYFENNGAANFGIRIIKTGASASGPDAMTIEGSHIVSSPSGNQAYGIRLEAGDRHRIKGTRFQNHNSADILFSGTVTRVIRENNSTSGSAAHLSGAATSETVFDGGTVKIALARTSPTYGASVAIDASLGNEFDVTATNGTAFTVANPTNAQDGQRITITIRNASGGALGAVTWDTLYKLAAWTSPADVNSRSIDFKYNGTNWVEVSRTPNDVPN